METMLSLWDGDAGHCSAARLLAILSDNSICDGLPSEQFAIYTRSTPGKAFRTVDCIVEQSKDESLVKISLVGRVLRLPMANARLTLNPVPQLTVNPVMYAT